MLASLTKEEDEQRFLAVKQKLGVSDVTMKILWARDIRSYEDFKQLQGRGELSDPFLLPDMEKAVAHLQDFGSRRRSIRVYGDYDADGVSATALMYQGLLWAGFENVDYYIPNRFDEGYGLNTDAVIQADHDGIDLLITVDCGSSSLEAAEMAERLGIKLIITDHHGLPPRLPKSAAMVNPERMKNPNRLSGAGVALQVLRALLRESLPEWAYGVAATGTVADVVPLTGDNRRIVQRGLAALKSGSVPGVQVLLQGRVKEPQELKVDDLGFYVGPHLNAAGRMEDAKPAVRMLLSSTAREAEPFVRILLEKNLMRRNLEHDILNQALEQVSEYSQTELPSFVVLAQDNWHHGVIGIVASRIREMLKRPVAVIGWENDEGKGSARGVPGLNLLEHLTKNRDKFLKLGGHRGACGFSLVKQDAHQLSVTLSQALPPQVREERYTDNTVDARIKAEDITPAVLDELRSLEPFGHGFERPRFAVSGIAQGWRTMGQNQQHLSLTLGGSQLRAVGFNQGQHASGIESGRHIEFIGELMPNFYHGQENYQWRIEKFVQSRPQRKDWQRIIRWEFPSARIDGSIVYVVDSTCDQRQLAQELNALYFDRHWDYGMRAAQEEALRRSKGVSIVVNHWGGWPTLHGWARHVIWLTAPLSRQYLAMAAAILDEEGIMWITPNAHEIGRRVLLKAKRLAPERETLAHLWRQSQSGRKPLIVGRRIFEELELDPGLQSPARRRLSDSPSYQRAHELLNEIRSSWQYPLTTWIEDV